MSKESYARGFCKAAAAAGVDPVALAKYAQQYKTDGWAPKGTPGPKSGQIPWIPLDTLEPVEGSKGRVGENIADYFTYPEKDSVLRDLTEKVERLKKISPKYNAYFNAHGESIRDASKAWRTIAPNLTDYVNLDNLKDIYSDALADVYHNGMFSRTGTVSRASSPVKK